MRLIEGYTHAFRGLTGVRSACRVRLYLPDAAEPGEILGDAPVVIVSELPDNPGTSVTNAIEQIAAEVMDAHRLVVFDGTSLMRSPFAVRSWWLSLRRENLHAQPKSVPHRTHQRGALHPPQASRRPHRSSLGGGAGKDRAFGRRRDLQQGDRPEALHQPSNGLQMAQAVLRGGVRWTGGSTTLGQAADLSPLR